MSTITSTGLGSGLDINNIVDTLKEAEQAPQQSRLDFRKEVADATISGVARLKSALSTFQSALNGLASVDEVSSLVASSSDDTIFSASAGVGAVQGSYKIEVEQLAQADKYLSDQVFTAEQKLVTTSTSISISAGDRSFSIDVGVNDNLTDLMNNINNSEDNDLVVATIIEGDAGQKLVITAREPGSDNAITIDPGASGLTFTNTEPAQNAIVYVDGQLRNSASNVIEDVIAGVTLALDQADPGNEHILSIYADPTDLEEKITTMVTEYNQLLKVVSELQYGGVDENGDTFSALLPNDATLRGLMTQIRREMGSSVDGGGQYNSLASLGVTTNRDGTLAVDVRRLRSGLDAGISKMAVVFGEADKGIANRLDSQIDTYLKYEGILDQRSSNAESQLERLAKEQETLDMRMDKFEARLLAQLNAMDSVVGLLSNTGSYLDQQLSLLPFGGGLNKNK